MSWVVNLKCAAIGCDVRFKTHPTASFFCFPDPNVTKPDHQKRNKGRGKKVAKKAVGDHDEVNRLLGPELPDMSKFETKEDLTPHKQFQIRQDFEDKFKVNFVREEISDTLHALLTGKKYSDAEAQDLSMQIADHIRNRIQGNISQRYKIIVQVILGELKGAGVKCGARCLWDPECDAYVSEHYMNSWK